MFAKIFAMSIKGVLNNKLRSFLTMLGIIIGVVAVVVLVSITSTTAQSISSTISNMGSLQIKATITDEDVSLSKSDISSLKSYQGIENVAPIISATKTAKHKTNRGSFTVQGVENNYFDVQDLNVQRGRVLLDSDVEWKTNVCVIGTSVATSLFDTWDAVGGTIVIGDKNYKVVGVLEEQGSSMEGSDDSKILLPFSTAEILASSTDISTFYVKATSEDMVSTAKKSVENYLYQKTKDTDTYEVTNASDVLQTMNTVNNTMSLLLMGIAGISLIVGGIGIMNIMLVSVSERTPEIGIRKSVGAKRRHILGQFLCESCILSLLGGIIGLVLSFVVLQVYSFITGEIIGLDLSISLVAILFCIVIGMVFGIYPAAKASKLQPLRALQRI